MGEVSKILVIISKWPSKEHPYLVHLFYQLKLRYPKLQFFQYGKPEKADLVYAEGLIGEEAVRKTRAGSLYRLKYSKRPWELFRIGLSFLKNLKQSLGVYRRLRKKGYSAYRAIGQLVYSSGLIGKKYDLVYINALQIARHIPFRILFPSALVICSSRGQDFDFAEVGHYDKILQDIDHLHVLGSYLADRAASRNFPRDRMTVIPPAILPGKITARHKDLDRNVVSVISVSRLFWSKGYSYAMQAIAKLKEKLQNRIQVVYVIIGDGPEMEMVKVEAHRLGISDSIILTGWLNQAEIDEYLAQANIGLLLSIEEGFNNSVMQAQQFGLPCVVSDAGGLPENVLDGETGYVVPRYDVALATDRLYKLVTEPELRRAMGEAAQRRMKSMFALEMQVAKYTAMFQKVILNERR